MRAKLGLTVLASLLATVPCASGLDPTTFLGSIGGAVKNPEGVPQMGAVVLLFNGTERLIGREFTDGDGSFRFDSLLPGLYSVKVSLASYVPALRPNIVVRPGREGFLSINLATLFSSVELVYMTPGQSPLMNNDWKWVLRGSIATRPVLRLTSNKSGAATPRIEDSPHDVFSQTRGLLALSGGESGMSSLGSQSDLGTAFALATSIYGSNQLLFSGNLGYGPGSGTPMASFRTRFSRANGQDTLTPDVELTVHRAFVPSRVGNALLDAGGQSPMPSFKSVSLSIQDQVAVMDNLLVQYGFSLESVSFLDTLHYLSPYARASYDLGDGGTLYFAYSSGAPPVALLQSSVSPDEKLIDTMLMEDLEALSYFPRVSLRGGRAEVQRSNNLEIGYRKKFGSRTLSAAAYRERVSNAALNLQAPAGEFDAGDVLPDLASSGSTYIFNIGRYESLGYMATVSQHLGDNLTVSLSYGRGGALTAEEGATPASTAEDLRQMVRTTQRNWASTRVAGLLPVSGTHFDASYQWSDARTLNPVHAYITQGMVPMSGLNISVRQPIPAPWLMPGRFEANAELQNLLSQGYLPIMTSDDRKVMLIHSPRAVRGGFSFIF